MKHFLFVSVAVGIFSGTSLYSKAQTNVNFSGSEFRTPIKNPIKFIEGIELNQAVIQNSEDLKITVAPSIAEENTTKIIKASKENKINTIEQCSALQFKYAMLTSRDVESVTDLDLYSFIDEWWATRYRYGGTTKKGIDCSAYVGTLLREVYGFEVPRTARAQYDICEKINKEDLLEGDLVFFNTRGGVSHVGLYLGNGYFTHSSSTNGVTISRMDDNYYTKRFIGGGRVNQ